MKYLCLISFEAQTQDALSTRGNETKQTPDATASDAVRG
jgi:hypothetical protein